MEGKKTLLSNSIDRAMWLQRDGSDPANIYTVVEQHHDNGVEEMNARARSGGLIQRGHDLGALGKFRFRLQIPSVPIFNEFMRDHPDIEEMFNSSDPDQQIRGAERMALLHPEWIAS